MPSDVRRQTRDDEYSSCPLGEKCNQIHSEISDILSFIYSILIYYLLNYQQ